MKSDTTRRRFLLILLVLSVVLLAVLIQPLSNALLLAAVLSGVLSPLHRRLTRWVGRRAQVSAGLLVFGTVVVVLGPLAGFSAYAVEEAADGVTFVSEALKDGGVDGLVEAAPAPMRATLHEALDTVRKNANSDVRKTVQAKLNEQAAKLAAALGGALAATWALVFNSAMMLIALFFMLTQGHELVAWLDKVLPLGYGQTRELLAEFKKTSYAVVVSTVVTAAAQALAALVGYLIARVPHPLFFTAITFFGAFIPAVGAATFVLLAALILLITGHPYFALFLALWGVIVVGLVDNVVKPIVMRGGMNMPGAVVFFSLIGGLSAFGPIGLILGPLTVAFFVATLRIYHRIEQPEPVVITTADHTTHNPAPGSGSSAV